MNEVYLANPERYLLAIMLILVCNIYAGCRTVSPMFQPPGYCDPIAYFILKNFQPYLRS